MTNKVSESPLLTVSEVMNEPCSVIVPFSVSESISKIVTKILNEPFSAMVS